MKSFAEQLGENFGTKVAEEAHPVATASDYVSRVLSRLPPSVRTEQGLTKLAAIGAMSLVSEKARRIKIAAGAPQEGMEMASMFPPATPRTYLGQGLDWMGDEASSIGHGAADLARRGYAGAAGLLHKGYAGAQHAGHRAMEMGEHGASAVGGAYHNAMAALGPHLAKIKGWASHPAGIAVLAALGTLALEHGGGALMGGSDEDERHRRMA